MTDIIPHEDSMSKNYHSSNGELIIEPWDAPEDGGNPRKWEPIKTAPRDGSWAWLWNKHCDEPQRFRWSTNYSIFGLGGCWTEGLSTMGDGVDFDYWWAGDLPADYPLPPNLKSN